MLTALSVRGSIAKAFENYLNRIRNLHRRCDSMVSETCARSALTIIVEEHVLESTCLPLMMSVRSSCTGELQTRVVSGDSASRVKKAAG